MDRRGLLPTSTGEQMTDLVIKIGGAAGQGLQRAALLLGRTFVRGGYHVFAIQDSMSRIRGGHNFVQLRVSDQPVGAMTGTVDLLVALDQETVQVNGKDLREGGIALLDAGTFGLEQAPLGWTDVPLKALAMELGGKPVYTNSAALGYLLGLIGFGMDLLAQAFAEAFQKGDLAAKNTAVARAGYELAQSARSGAGVPQLKPLEAPPRLFLTGNDAICLGAIAADCRFMSAYPMSPSTSIITYLAGREESVGLVTEQAEDEIAAINLALGASMAGVRAMTATSGGGLSLMSETISFLGVSEVPLVIVDCQRPGPATGMPTRTEQSDLLFAINSGNGEFPRAVLAPGNAEQAFHCTVQAFNLADRYQVPVLLLSDQHLSESFYTVEPFSPEAAVYESSTLDAEALGEMEEYRRYLDTEDGVSPRSWPGQSDRLVLTDSHEHDETGRITEEPGMRVRMVEKRQRKLDGIKAGYGGPERIGPSGAETIVVGWGSTREVLGEAVTILRSRGEDVSLLHYAELWPLPEGPELAALREARRLVVVEGNVGGQLASVLRGVLGRRELDTVLRYDGRPFLVEELVEELAEVVGA